MSSGEEAQENELLEEGTGKFDKNEVFAEEAIPKQSLTKDIIAECIGMPYRLGYGFSHAFVKLDASDRNLLDINVLREYIHLRFIILSNNYISDISPCSVIGHLIYLKADNNQITDAGCLNSLRFLQFLDLSGNKLTKITNLSFPLLQHLKVNDNMISSIQDESGKGFDVNQLPALHTLELRRNQLTTLKGLGQLSNLRSLYCAENMISSTAGVEGLASLVRFHARNNQLKKLDGFENWSGPLEYLNLRDNKVTSYNVFRVLKSAPCLKMVSFLGNPIVNSEGYRKIALGMLPHLQRLDKVRTTDQEREEAMAYFKAHPVDDDISRSSAGVELPAKNSAGAGSRSRSGMSDTSQASKSSQREE